MIDIWHLRGSCVHSPPINAIISRTIAIAATIAISRYLCYFHSPPPFALLPEKVSGV